MKANMQAVRAHVRIETSDGVIYEMDLVDVPEQGLQTDLSIDTEAVETRQSREGLLMWREYEPGHRTGTVTIRGRLVEARRIAPSAVSEVA